jgi:hypothetical protein
MDSHDSTKHYVNGPEAFLTTLLAEFKDAQKRFEEISNRISKLVTPPVSDAFDDTARLALRTGESVCAIFGLVTISHNS